MLTGDALLLALFLAQHSQLRHDNSDPDHGVLIGRAARRRL